MQSKTSELDDYPQHKEVKAVVYDLKTGEFHTDDRTTTFQWTENNWSCDCNRHPLPNIDCVGRCEGCNRFIVVDVQPLLEGYALDEFNQGYPKNKRDYAYEMYRLHGKKI